MQKLSLLLGLGLFSAGLLHAADAIEGRWQTHDDKTRQPKGIVEIKKAGTAYVGTITEVLPAAATKICTQCTGKDKNRPLAGLTVLTGLQKTAANEYDNGKIFDPGSGKTYSAAAKVTDGGKKLELRGYLGMKMLGRTQTWTRL